MRTKKSYHSDFIIRYKLGLLPKELVTVLPSSTLFNWRNRDMSKLFGGNEVMDSDENINMIKDFLTKKKLLCAAKTLYFIYSVLASLLDKVKQKNKLFRESSEIILETIEKVRHIIGFKRTLRLIGISYQQFYAWKNKISCKTSFLDWCRKKQSNQLLMNEINVVKFYLTDVRYLYWSLVSVYYQMLRDKAAAMCISTFYKYVHLLKLERFNSLNRSKKHVTGIRAETPYQILQMDATLFRPLDNSRVYIYFIIDNFSRCILGWKVALVCSAKMACENLKQVIVDHQLMNTTITLVTDGGSENKGKVNEFLLQPEVDIKKLVAQQDIIFSNSMIEAVNKKIKYEFLFTKELRDFDSTENFLKTAVPEYNNKPHGSLNGYTPLEVLNGQILHKNTFAQEILLAKEKRITENLVHRCDICPL